jgi:hypothetical protein
VAESSDLTPKSERTRRLAERFGMAPADLDELLSATHAEYGTSNEAALNKSASSEPASPTPVPPARTPIEQAAERIAPVPAPKPRRTPPPNKQLSAGTIIAIFTVLLIALGVAVSFQEGCFRQRKDRVAQKPIDTVQRMLDTAAARASAPQAPTQVPAGQLPPESVTIPREAPVGTTGPPAPAASHTAKPLLSTTSEFQAEEKLAELRADGNTHARLRATRKHGSVRYEVMGR